MEQTIAVSIPRAAELLSVSPRTIQNLLRHKALAHRKIGRRTVIPYTALQALIRRDSQTATEQAS